MKDNMCKIQYECFLHLPETDCIYKTKNKNRKSICIYQKGNIDTRQIFCTSSIANTNRLVIELERITGMKLKENLTV